LKDNLLICNFCELFGFNSKEYPVSRLSIKIDSHVYPAGHEFLSGTKYHGFDISNHIDDLALIYFDENQNLVLHMFVPDGTAMKKFMNLQPEKKLYRYGKAVHIKKAYETGQFLIFPALEFMKKEYDEGRRDKEVIHTRSINSDKVKITLAKNNIPIQPIGDITYSTIHLPIDSYILCFSYDYDEGLYNEFKGSDSCLIINDVVQFTERIHDSFNKVMPNYIGSNARVTYSKHLSSFGVLFSKARRYIYQREYRFAWVTINRKSSMLNPMQIINESIEEIKKIIPKPVEINIGSLQDISNVVVR